MMSEARRFRLGIWAVVFFVLAVSVPGWFVQMRLVEQIGRLEKRVAELETQIEAGSAAEATPDSE
jgi:hypothetical protein